MSRASQTMPVNSANTLLAGKSRPRGEAEPADP
jgi:hypothetical protein